LRRLGWERIFVKDHVKSLKTSVGSIVEDPKEIETVVSEMEKYRGFILVITQIFVPNGYSHSQPAEQATENRAWGGAEGETPGIQPRNTLAREGGRQPFRKDYG
jgi:hypothetical protein